jgi:hypothetical protein
MGGLDDGFNSFGKTFELAADGVKLLFLGDANAAGLVSWRLLSRFGASAGSGLR